MADNRLNDLKGKVDNYILAENSLISSPFAKVKVISRGELTAKIDLETQFASKSAVEAIKNAYIRYLISQTQKVCRIFLRASLGCLINMCIRQKLRI